MNYQPLYIIYLKQGGSEKEPLYKFIHWQNDNINEYKRFKKDVVIRDTKDYIKWVSNKYNIPVG